MYRYDRRYNDKPAISKEEIVELYINQNISFEKLLEVCELPRTQMVKYLSKNGITKKAVKAKKQIDKEILEKISQR